MNRTALPFVKKEEANLPLRELERYTQGWLLACEIRPCSPATLANRRLYVKNLLWFLKRRAFTECGVMELRAFFAYFNTAHKEPGGRWGNPQETTPVKPATVAAYHRHLRALFNWIVEEGALSVSPMARIPVPIDRPDQVQPFSDEQVKALLAAAKKSQFSRRDEAILWFLLDTGVRASELCDLTFRDLDMTARKATIREGKGGKSRAVYFGKVTAKALWSYLKEDGREEDDPVFLSRTGEALTRCGLAQAIERLGKAAGIQSARVSPHTFRHTCAVSFLRNGGDQFSLMTLLGHQSVTQTARYVKLAASDAERKHRQFSPADSLKGKGGKR